MEFDYIVVGTGSAGSVAAARLSEIADATTLVLEAGGKDQSPWIHIPVGYVKTLNGTRVNWQFSITPESHTGDRTMILPRGKVLGGSSSINGMLYVRGNARDYDGWAQLGNRGWSYADVLPFFKKTESRIGGDDAIRGRDGPLNVDAMPNRNALMEATLRAGEELGYPSNPDYNGASQDGFSYYQVTQKSGLRHSAFRAFLKPVLGRPNLHLRTGALVHRVIIEDGRATGVAFECDGQVQVARARREVVLSAGAVQSPQLLELSGIGAPEVLAAHGIPVLHALPGVGENYIDHFMVRMAWRIQGARTLNEETRGLSLVRAVLQYAFTRRGALASPAALVAGFVKSRPGLEIPDVQYHIAPASYADTVKKLLEDEPGYSVGTYQMRPESKGSIHIDSPDPRQQPKIVGRYLTLQYDLDTLVAGIRIARQLMATQALGQYVVRETLPGPEVATDDEVADFARHHGIAIYHPVGTCKMGSDPMAVVDDGLRVHGIAGLRVMDASVMPTMTSGNTHAPTMMIAEKGAEMIKADTGH